MTSRSLDHVRTFFDQVTQNLDSDPELHAASLGALGSRQPNTISFGIGSSETDPGSGPKWLVIKIEISGQGSLKTDLRSGSGEDADFFLHARPQDWDAFFKPDHELQRPYQSYWGMLRVLSPSHPEVRITGDTTAFARYSRIWRIVLDRIRDTINSKPSIAAQTELPLPSDEETEDDAITGKYTWIMHATHGKCKIFHESSGSGPQILLFLHTAGSDSRQYHTLMNNAELLAMYTMYAFDLPGHGRSTLGTRQHPETYALTEEAYLESIEHVIKKLNLTRNDNLILCGASMAGHICLAAAIKARHLGVRGVIPCEGAAHLPLSQPIYEITGADASILDPERVCGMIAPGAPAYYKRQIWWQYSSQGSNVFAGDLKFYFRGWDGRGRVEGIDTGYCPVVMLTGEFDYSCTTEMSEETCEMIKGKGKRFERMAGLGHFPGTEEPGRFVEYLVRAVEWIQGRWEGGEER